MRKKILFLQAFLLLCFFIKPAFAIECQHELKFYSQGSLVLEPIEGQFDWLTLSVKVWDTNDLYTISSDGPAMGLPDQVRFRSEHQKPGGDGWLPTQTITTSRLLKAGTHFFSIINERLGGEYCLITFNVAPAPTPTSGFVNCRLEAKADDGKFTASSIITIKGVNIPPLGGGATYQLRIRSEDGKVDEFFPVNLTDNSFSQQIGSFNYNTYEVVLRACARGCDDTHCQTMFTIHPTQGWAPTPLPTGISFTPTVPAKLEDICNQVADNPKTSQNEHQDCLDCVRKGYAYTAIGCLPTDISKILKEYIFVRGLGIAGGIAFLLILFGGFTILTSTGNPEQVAKGKELITSALAGLLLIIFSVFILRLIGVEILKIPGFGP